MLINMSENILPLLTNLSPFFRISSENRDEAFWIVILLRDVVDLCHQGIGSVVTRLVTATSNHKGVGEAEACCVQISKRCLSDVFERIPCCMESLSRMVVKHSNGDSFLTDGWSY